MHIVMYKIGNASPWRSANEGEFSERRLADNFIECKRAAGYTWKYAIVSGPVIEVKTREGIDAELGQF